MRLPFDTRQTAFRRKDCKRWISCTWTMSRFTNSKSKNHHNRPSCIPLCSPEIMKLSKTDSSKNLPQQSSSYRFGVRCQSRQRDSKNPGEPYGALFKQNMGLTTLAGLLTSLQLAAVRTTSSACEIRLQPMATSSRTGSINAVNTHFLLQLWPGSRQKAVIKGPKPRYRAS